MLRHRLEVAILSQKLVATIDAVSRDHHIDGGSNGDAALAQIPVVSRGFSRQFFPSHFDDLKLQQDSLDPVSLGFPSTALKDFQQNKIANEDIR